MSAVEHRRGDKAWGFNISRVYCLHCGWGLERPIDLHVCNNYGSKEEKISFNDLSRDNLMPEDEYNAQVKKWKKAFNFCPNCGADMRGDTE